MRKLLCLVMAAFMIYGLSACGNEEKGKAPQNENAKQEQTKSENIQTEADACRRWDHELVICAGGSGG